MPTIVSPATYQYSQRGTVWSSVDNSTYVEMDFSVQSQLGDGDGTIVRVVNYDPSWREKVANGVDASLPYMTEGWEYQVPHLHGESRITDWNGYRLARQDTFWLANLPKYAPPASSSADDRAVARIKAKLRDHNGDVDLLAPLGELRELRDSINFSVRYTHGFVQQLIRLRDAKKKLKETLAVASDLWLGYNFGIAPMIKDTQEALKAVDNFLQHSQKTFVSHSSAKQDWITHYSGTGLTGLFGTNIKWDVQTIHRLSFRYTLGYDFAIKASNHYGIAEHLGLTRGQLVPAAWALTPYSWIVDYFTTVGSYLKDVFYTPPGTTKYVVKNRKYTAESKVFLSYEKPAPYIDFVRASGGHGFANYYRFDRYVLPELPTRSLRFKTYDEVGFNGLKKLLNLTALLLK